MYLSNGTFTASSSSVGGSAAPVYLKSGVITAISAVDTAHGGTGATAHTANRLVWSATATQLKAENHYASATKIAVNSATEPTQNFYVNGSAGFNGNILLNNGNLTIHRDTSKANDYPSKIIFEVKQTDNNITTSAYIATYDDHDANAYGTNMVISSRGSLVIGGGESAETFYTAAVKGTSSEATYITSDGNIHFYTKCDTIDNRVGVTLDTSRQFYPILASANSADGSLGTVSNNWSTTHTRIIKSNNTMTLTPTSTMYIDSGSGSSIIFRPQGVEQGRFNTAGKLLIRSGGAADATIEGPATAGTFKFPDTGGTFVTHATKGTAVGSSTKPVYIASTGRATAGSNYAGGTKVTLNGTEKGATTATFYAPTTPGSSGQVLTSKAANADPTWVNQRALDVGKLEGYTRSNLYADLPTWLSAVGLTYTITVDGDKDTYYPVRIYLSSDKSIPTTVSIHKNLGSKTPAYSSGNHSNGTSSMWIIYEGRNSCWDGNGGYLKTLYYHMQYAQLCAEVKQGTGACGDIIIWLRGGGCEYKITTTSKVSAPTIYYTETNVGTTNYPDLVAPKTTLGNAGIYSSTVLGYGDISGNSSTTTKLKNSRNIFGKSFNGTADVAGQALVYGTYTSTAGQRYANGGLQIREAGLVGNAQTDIGYAPAIGFHWNGKKAASLLFHHDGLFYFRAQDGTTRATVDANVQGNASTATALTSSAGSGTQPIYFSNGKPTATTYALNKTVPSNAVFTDANVTQGKSTTANWRPILSHNTYHATYGTDPGNATGGVYYTPSIAIQPSTGTLRATKFIGEFEGTITNAKKLSNYYSTRPTTLSPGITGDGSVQTFKCTSSVTDTDDPGDGHVLHFNWDNNGGYDSQILLMTSSSTMKYRGMNGKTWQPWVTSIDSGNYTQYTVKKDGTGASGTWNISISGTAAKATADVDGNTIKTTYAKLASMNNLVHSGNEITIVPDGYSGELWLNWRTCGGSNGNITKYNFGNGKNGTSGVTLVASNFSGVAAKATLLETARTIFGKSFNGGADVKGSALVYGTYTATANQRYNNAGLQIREADQVLATQSDIGYAPSISFHWGNRIAATLLFHNDGVFYFRKQDGVTRATVDANVTQVNGVIPEWAGSISNADARWIAAWTTDGKKIKALDKNTMTVLGASQATGTTFSIKNASGGDVDLIFDRNTNASWKVLNSQGNLHFQTDWTNSKGGYYDVMKLHYNTGNMEIKGNIKVGGGCTLEYDSSQQSLKFIFT